MRSKSSIEGTAEKLTEHAPQLRVVVYIAWIKIVSDGSFEKRGVLRNDS
jgi:hypothetical protein